MAIKSVEINAAGYLVVAEENGNATKYAISGGSGMTNLPAAEALSISSGAIAPTLPTGLYSSVNVSGEGGTDDDLASIVAPSSWIGKLLLIKKTGAGAITLIAGANILMASDFTLDSPYDRILLECIAVNTWVQHYRSSNA